MLQFLSAPEMEIQSGCLCTTCVMPTNYSGSFCISVCSSKSLFTLPFHVFAVVMHIASMFRYLSSVLKYECIACTAVLIRVHFTNPVEVAIYCVRLLSREEGLTFPGFWCHRWAAVHVSPCRLLLPRTVHLVSLMPRSTSTHFWGVPKKTSLLPLDPIHAVSLGHPSRCLSQIGWQSNEVL